jgi:hypothetical protein
LELLCGVWYDGALELLCDALWSFCVWYDGALELRGAWLFCDELYDDA